MNCASCDQPLGRREAVCGRCGNSALELLPPVPRAVSPEVAAFASGDPKRDRLVSELTTFAGALWLLFILWKVPWGAFWFAFLWFAPFILVGVLLGARIHLRRRSVLRILRAGIPAVGFVTFSDREHLGYEFEAEGKTWTGGVRFPISELRIGTPVRVVFLLGTPERNAPWIPILDPPGASR